MTCGLVVTGILYEWLRGTLVRHRGGEEYPVAFVRLLSANRPRYGGYVVHLAIIMLAAGAIASSFYSVQRDFAMTAGDSATVGDYNLTFIGTRHASYPDRQEDYARFEVFKGDTYLGIMEALRAEYPAFRIASTQGAIHSTPVEDFYIVPSELDREGPAIFRVLINPMVWWMWASGPVLILGTLLALSPRRRPAPAVVPSGTGARVVRA
jgi:cytochrome c-type biogenesis protein CcmF